MKKLLIIALLILLFSCSDDNSKIRINPYNKQESNKKDIKEEADSVVVKEIQYKYKSSILEDDGINSYWFVRVTDKKGVKWTNVIKQTRSYLSLSEAEKSFRDSKIYNPKRLKDKVVYIVYFTQVSEATYIDYEKNN